MTTTTTNPAFAPKAPHASPAATRHRWDRPAKDGKGNARCVACDVQRRYVASKNLITYRGRGVPLWVEEMPYCISKAAKASAPMRKAAKPTKASKAAAMTARASKPTKAPKGAKASKPPRATMASRPTRQASTMSEGNDVLRGALRHVMQALDAVRNELSAVRMFAARIEAILEQFGRDSAGVGGRAFFNGVVDELRAHGELPAAKGAEIEPAPARVSKSDPEALRELRRMVFERSELSSAPNVPASAPETVEEPEAEPKTAPTEEPVPEEGDPAVSPAAQDASSDDLAWMPAAASDDADDETVRLEGEGLHPVALDASEGREVVAKAAAAE